MTKDYDAPLHLTRTDPARNMARFYVLVLQPTLFGGVSVIRKWGRIGTHGRQKVETYDGGDAASTACRRLERTKRQRGYR
tara:strand:+ start:807 stop:1046 length:240 start_codon:yes stop_codon:yes gene_type:complete